LRNKKIDETIIPFLSSILTVVFKVLVLISVASMFGIETTSFVALVGAAGLAIGLALQGSLAHFASGVLILVFKPYKVGDKVQIGEYVGDVTAIQIFNTLLRTADNKIIIIPNSVVTSAPITNISGQGTLKLVLSFMTDYSADIDKVKSIIMDVLDKNPKVLNDPKPGVHYNSKGTSLAIYECMPWCKSEDGVALYYEIQEEVRRAFDKNGIKAPEVGLEFGIN
jgi:small conductance mechanosensitive channel